MGLRRNHPEQVLGAGRPIAHWIDRSVGLLLQVLCQIDRAGRLNVCLQTYYSRVTARIAKS